MPEVRVLTALDAARIQWYHFKAIIVAGMGLFTDAYDLFCIAPIMKMISHIYYHKDSMGTAVLSIFYAIALLGTASGQLIFGYLGDRVGRRRVYGLCLLIMVISSFGCGFSVCTTRRSCVMASLGIFRFVLGLGIGGDYPLSATIMSEFANKRTRGAFIAAVFSMQGFGILMSSAVTMVVCAAFKYGDEGSLRMEKAAGMETLAPAESDIAWRLILMIGAIPAALTFYWRMLVPETARTHKFSVCTTRRSCVMASLGIFRFVLGLGIGGDYPLSATIMSEFANKRTRGAFIAAVFSMQGFGILMSSAVTMVVCAAFKYGDEGSLRMEKAAGMETLAPAESDIAWRLILMIGAIPAALTFYWRMLVPETARYTALVENNVVQAAKDMRRVMSVSISSEVSSEDSPPETLQNLQQPSSPSSASSPYKLFSRRFFALHGRDLFATSACWFLVDVVFYTSNLLLSEIFNFSNKAINSANVYDSAFEVAKLAAIVAACSTIPGYWFTVYFIDRIGRVKIQIMGFFMMAVVYLVAGIPYSWYWSKHDKTNKVFMVLYGLIFFFSNFGPNTTTFIIPAELFPARFRSTCHGISGAAGKFGAIVGTVGFLWATKYDETDKGNFYPDVKRMRIAFLILGGVCIAGVLVTYFFTRETMGRSLEENEEEEICST